jgi:hypothetical protein
VTRTLHCVFGTFVSPAPIQFQLLKSITKSQMNRLAHFDGLQIINDFGHSINDIVD